MATGTKALAENGHHFAFQTILSHPGKSSHLGVTLTQPLWGHAAVYLHMHTFAGTRISAGTHSYEE